MSVDKAKYTNRIRQLIPINELPQDIQNQVINNATLVKIKKNGFVFKQGDRDNFSFYLLEGEIELQANKQVHSTIVGGTDRARYAMAQLQPRQFSGKAKDVSIVMKVARDSLDRLLILHQEKSHDDWGKGGEVVVSEMEVGELDDDENVDWMTRMLQSEIFSKMPTANIHQLFALLEPVNFSKGDVVIKQGEPGEDYYIIQEGRCEVTRKPNPDSKDVKLAELRAGDSFGEEALLAETTRNATITMLTDGVLMRLSKENFINLIRNPTLHAIPFGEARLKVESGAAKWLDVRFKNEHEKSAIKPSMNIPLNVLRMEMDKLDKGGYYIVYCDTGGRSSSAAFLLAGRGFDVSYLKGGLVNSPGAADPSEVTNVPKPEKAETPAAAQPKARPEAGKKSAAAGSDEDNLDPGVKASVLDVELTQTNIKLQEVAKQQHDRTDVTARSAQIQAQKKLEAERAKLEAAKKAAEDEVRKLRLQEEEKFNHMKSEAEKRLHEEKKKLEEIYSRNVEEVEKLERLKQDAEEKAQLERERLEKQERESSINHNEAERIRKELEESRRALEEQARKQKLEQEEMARKIQTIARKKLEEERKKMAEQYARNNEELDQARRERAAAEAARVAARKEAEKLISEYQAEHDRVRAEEEERLRAERRKLEEEQRKIQETLQEIQKAREEAESIKQAAMSEVNALKEKQKQQAVTQNDVTQNSLKEELKQAEARLNKAKLSIAQSQQQSVKIQEAKRVNAAELAKQTAEEEALNSQLAEDLESFKEELDEQEKEYASARTQMEHMRRIKERADAAKRAAEDANSDLLSDIASQLGRSD